MLLLILKLSNLFAGLLMQSAKIKYNWYYTVSLTVSSSYGSDIETKINYISVGENPPNAAFTASPTSGNYPLAVNFIDLSSGSVTSWSWTFGDGGTSTAENPSHQYNSAGNYAVSLTVSGP